MLLSPWKQLCCPWVVMATRHQTMHRFRLGGIWRSACTFQRWEQCRAKMKEKESERGGECFNKGRNSGGSAGTRRGMEERVAGAENNDVLGGHIFRFTQQRFIQHWRFWQVALNQTGGDWLRQTPSGPSLHCATWSNGYDRLYSRTIKAGQEFSRDGICSQWEMTLISALFEWTLFQLHWSHSCSLAARDTGPSLFDSAIGGFWPFYFAAICSLSQPRNGAVRHCCSPRDEETCNPSSLLASVTSGSAAKPFVSQ